MGIELQMHSPKFEREKARQAFRDLSRPGSSRVGFGFGLDLGASVGRRRAAVI
jgi:hypothetical protein